MRITKRRVKTTIITLLILLFWAFTGLGLVYTLKKDGISLEVENYVVAHAGGGLDGHKYLNVEEAFYYHYENGTRWFEYDLAFSLEKEIIGTHLYEYHKGSYRKPISYQDYKNTKVLGKYTGVTLPFLFDVIENYPDVKILLDTKQPNATSLIEAIVSKAEQAEINIFDNFIPQLYSIQMWENLKEFEFKQFIYANYKSRYTSQKIYNFVKQDPRIKLVITPYISNLFYNNDKFKKIGVEVGVHTLNIKSWALFFKKTGVTKIYSAFLFENDLK